jgi:hypothetical protein
MNKAKWLVLIIGLVVLAGGFMLLRPESKVDVNAPADGESKNEVPDAVSESTIDDSIKNWKVALGDGLSFSYPAELGTSYIIPKTWPPQAFVLGLNGPVVCANGGAETAPSGLTTQKTVAGHTYCVTSKIEGTGNTAYTNYIYSFEKDKKVLALLITLRFIPCGGYPPEKKIVCETERKNFNIDAVADKMAQSFKISKIEAAPTNMVAPAGQ